MECTHEITVIPFNVLHYFLKLPSEKNKTKQNRGDWKREDTALKTWEQKRETIGGGNVNAIAMLKVLNL